MEREHFSADRLPQEARWMSWRHNLSAFAIHAEGEGGPAFDGRIITCVAPSGVSFTRLESHAPQRMSAAAGKTGDVFWLAVSLSGASVLDLDGESVDMAPGDILYGKQGAPCALEISTEFRMLLVNIPAPLLARRVFLPLPDRAIHLSGRTGTGRIFSAMLSAVADSLEELDDVLAGPIEAALPQFLLTSLFGDGGELALAGATAARAGVLQRIWRTIEERLGEPELSIAEVAAENGLSIRYVQKLFEENGDNFSRYVRRRRLEQCRTDLGNPLAADVSITATCFRWGFNDSATFSRAFKEEFGLSPREYRRTRVDAPGAGRRRLQGLARRRPAVGAA